MKGSDPKKYWTFILMLLFLLGVAGCSFYEKRHEEHIIAVPSSLWPNEEKLSAMQEKNRDNERFLIKNSDNVKVTEQVLNKSIDVAVTVFEPEKNDVLSVKKAGVMPYVFCVSRKAGVKSLTKEQIQAIFLHKVSNWRDVGGKDMQIVVYLPNFSAAINREFSKQFLGGAAPWGIHLDTEEEIVPKVEKIAGSISYIESTLYKADITSPTVNVVAINGYLPDKDNIMSGVYPALLPINIVYRAGETHFQKIADFLAKEIAEENFSL